MQRIVNKSDGEFETWKNANRGALSIKRVNRQGDLVNERIVGGKTFQLTEAERRLNQEQAASPEYDPFVNGTLTPIRLIETAEDIEQLRGNPNHLSEDDMKALFKGRNLKTLQARLAEITNPIAVRRILEVAKEEDATINQVAAIEARLDEVVPKNEITPVITDASYGDKATAVRAK